MADSDLRRLAILKTRRAIDARGILNSSHREKEYITVAISKVVTIKPAKIGSAQFSIVGTSQYVQAVHISQEGWHGIPAGAFRQALLSACRLVGFKMTLANLGVFVRADGFDADGTPLVRIEGTPDWREWSATIVVRYEADQFTLNDVYNLFWMAGNHVGIGGDSLVVGYSK